MDSHQTPFSVRRKDSTNSHTSFDLKSDTESLKMQRASDPASTFRYQPAALYYGLRRGPVVIGLIEVLLGIILLFPSILVGNTPTCYTTIGFTILTGVVGVCLGCICIQPPNPLEITEHDVRSLLPMLEAYLALSVLSVCLSLASIAHGAVNCATLPVPPNWAGVVSITMGCCLFFLNIWPVSMLGQQLLQLRKPNVCADLTEKRNRPLLIGGYKLTSASSFNLSAMAQSAMRRSSSSSNTLHLLPTMPEHQVNLLRRLDNGPPVTIGKGHDLNGRSISVTVNEYN